MLNTRQTLSIFTLPFFAAIQIAQAQVDNATAAANAAAGAAAGYLSQGLDKQLPIRQSQNPSTQESKPAPKLARPGDADTFLLKRISFSGFSGVPYAELSQQVENYENQTVTLRSVEDIANKLVGYINSKGYIVQVFAPPQEVKDGVLNLQITQANLGGVNVSGAQDSTPLGSSAQSNIDSGAASYIYNQIQPGGVIDLAALDKAIIILNDQSSKTYVATLKQGMDEGQTDLVLESYDQNKVIGSIEANNYGVQSTGRGQAIGQVVVRNILGADENISVGAIASEGTSFFKLGYAMPLAANGLRLAIDVNTLNYRTTSSAATPATGNSQAESLQLSYPIFASKSGISRLYAAASNRTFQNNTYGQTISAYSLKAIALGVNGNFYGDAFVPSADFYNLSLLSGSAYNSTSPANYQSNIAYAGLTPVFTSYVPNSYTKLNGSYSKTFFLNDKSNFKIATSGQLASANLNSAENFYVSGPDAVRAYMPSVAYGSEGIMFNLDYGYNIRSDIGAGIFFDYATVRQYKSAVTSQMINTSTAPNTYNIAGAGIKATYKYENTADLTVFAAKPLDNVYFPSLLTTGGKPTYVFGAQGRVNF